MGPALLTKLLLPLLQKTASSESSSSNSDDVRVINLSSELYKQAPPEGVLISKVRTPLNEISSLARYGQSKLADYYHTRSLAVRYPNIKFVAIHPGVVNTGIFDDFRKRRPWLGAGIAVIGNVFLTNVKQGARAQLWAATTVKDKKAVRSGGFYNPKLVEYKDKKLDDGKLCRELEEWTEKEFASRGF